MPLIIDLEVTICFTSMSSKSTFYDRTLGDILALTLKVEVYTWFSMVDYVSTPVKTNENSFILILCTVPC